MNTNDILIDAHKGKLNKKEQLKILETAQLILAANLLLKADRNDEYVLKVKSAIQCLDWVIREGELK